jgi:hypothetical protein
MMPDYLYLFIVRHLNQASDRTKLNREIQIKFDFEPIKKLISKQIKRGQYIYRRKNVRSFTIFSLIPASANIAEIVWALKVYIKNHFKCVMNDVILQN